MKTTFNLIIVISHGLTNAYGKSPRISVDCNGVERKTMEEKTIN